MVYDYKKSIRENAELNHCTEANVRKYIQTHQIDRRGDEHIRRHKQITRLRKQGLSLRKIADKIGLSVATVSKYVKEDKKGWKDCVDLTKQSVFNRGRNKDLYRSVANSQHTILRSILAMHIPAKRFDCDLTYSIGNFYKRPIPQPRYKFDKYPDEDMPDVQPLDKAYQLESGVFDSVVMDLPFIIRKSDKSTSNTSKRFSDFSSYEELVSVNENMMSLAYRLLKDGGVLIMKTQDTNSGSIGGIGQIWVHTLVERLAESLGFDMEDLFINVSSHVQLRADLSEQRHARRFHSYFYVLKKREKK